MDTKQVYVQPFENVSSGDINSIGGLALQTTRDFNHEVFAGNDCIINGLQVTAPIPTAGSVSVAAGFAFYNSPLVTPVVPGSNPAVTLNFKGAIINIPAQVKGFGAPDLTNPRIDGLDIKYGEAQDTAATRAFIDSGGNIFTQSTNTKTTSISDVIVTLGTPSGSPVAPAVPAGYIRLAEITIQPGAGFNIQPSDIVIKLPRLWDEQDLYNGTQTPVAFNNTADQAKTLGDSLAAIRSQLNAIIGRPPPDDNWFSAPEISLHALTALPDSFVKNGADIRMFDYDTKPMTTTTGLWPNDLNLEGFIVGRGVIGFADGVIRRNTVEKYFDFSQAYAPGLNGLQTDSQRVGFIDTIPTSQPSPSTSFLKVSTRYAIFAVADHTTSSDFNIVVSEIPFITTGITLSNFNGNPATQVRAFYSGVLPTGFYTNKTVVRMALSKTNPNGMFNAINSGRPSVIGDPRRFTGPGDTNTDTGPGPGSKFLTQPQLSLANSNTLETVGGGNTAILEAGGGGSVYVIGGYAPTGFTRYRYLGSFRTDATGKILHFKITGEDVELAKPIIAYNQSYWMPGPFSALDSDFTLDLAGLVPGTASVANLRARITIDGGAGAQFVSARFARDYYAMVPPEGGPYVDGSSYGSSVSQSYYQNSSTRQESFSLPILQSTFRVRFIGSAYLNDQSGTFRVDVLGYKENIFDEWSKQ